MTIVQTRTVMQSVGERKSNASIIAVAKAISREGNHSVCIFNKAYSTKTVIRKKNPVLTRYLQTNTHKLCPNQKQTNHQVSEFHYSSIYSLSTLSRELFFRCYCCCKQKMMQPRKKIEFDCIHEITMCS